MKGHYLSISILILLLNFYFCFSAQPVDSLLDVLQGQPTPPAGKIKLARQLIHKVANNTYDHALGYKLLGNNYQYMYMLDSALESYKKCLDISEQNGYTGLMASCLSNISMIYNSVGNYQSALEYSLLSLDYDRKIGDSSNIASSLNAVAIVYLNLANYDKALEYQLQSVKTYKGLDNKIGLGNAYHNLGVIYGKLENLEEAMNYYTKAKKIFGSLEGKGLGLPVKIGYSKTLSSIAQLHEKKQEYDKALGYYEETAMIQDAIQDKSGQSKTYLQMGNMHFFKDNYHKALSFYQKALELKKQFNDQQGIAIAYANIGRVHLKMENFKESISYFNQSRQITEKIDYKEGLKEVLSSLAGAHEKLGEDSKALGYYRQHMEITKMLYDENTREAIEEMRVKFNTEAKEQQNIILTQENSIQKLELEKQQRVRNFLIGVTIFILTVVIIIWNQVRIKKRANLIISRKNELLQEKNESISRQKSIIEKINKNITDSIEYAFRIQEAMLVDMDKIGKTIPASFIYFKPRDIVSGDFYWYAQKNGKTIISAVDCTGHGVPGAFMSMLGDSYLKQIVHTRGITSPEMVLSELNKSINLALNQEEKDNSDGMDMALCVIDEKKRTLEFSGAKNPLVIVKNGEVKKIKGTKHCIGGTSREEKVFEKHVFQLNEPARFYIFSDGFQDQFGSNDRGKFKIKRFYKLLLDIQGEDMEEQKQSLDQALKEWMGDQKQIDDILVIGMKFS